MKRFLILFLIVLGIFIPMKVKAIESGFYEGEYLQNFYIKKFKNGRGVYQQMRVFRRKTDDKEAYCIELWKYMDSIKTLPGYDSNQASIAGLDNDTWNRIVLIAYYGYKYKDHTDIKWYGITQFMIWKEIEKESDIYFTDTLNGSRANLYEDEMGEINNLVNRHLIKPSFDTLYHLNLNETKTLVDTNNVLEDYNISSPSDLKYTRSGNTITITPTKKDNTNLTLYKKDNFYNRKPIVYINDSGQDLLMPGSYEEVSQNIVINVPTGSVKIHKYLKKENGEIEKEDAKFKVYNSKNEEVLEFETINGDALFTLPYGKYVIRQITGTKNYKYIDDLEIDVSSNQKNQEFNLYNEELVVPIKIIATDSESKKPILEKGIEFNIINTDTNETIKLETNNNGNTNTVKLIPGTYKITQIKVVDGYEINTEEKNLEINEDNYSFKEDVKEVIFENNKKTSNIEIEKLINYYFNDKLVDTKNDKDINIPIYAKEDIYTKDGNIRYSKNQEVDVITKQNNLVSKNLVYGNYYINNPINNEVIDISLDNDKKQVKIVEDIYKYGKRIDNIPDTYIEEKDNKYLSLLVCLIGFVLVYRGKKYE